MFTIRVITQVCFNICKKKLEVVIDERRLHLNLDDFLDIFPIPYFYFDRIIWKTSRTHKKWFVY